MRIVYGLIIGLTAAFFELFAAKWFSIKNVAPNLVPAFVLFAAFYGGRRMGLWAGFMAGLILDFYSRYYIGIGIIFYSAVGFTVGHMGNRFLFDSTAGKVLCLFAVNFLQSFILWFSTKPDNILDVFLISIMPRIFYSAVLGGILLYLSLLIVSKFSYIAALFRFLKK